MLTRQTSDSYNIKAQDFRPNDESNQLRLLLTEKEVAWCISDHNNEVKYLRSEKLGGEASKVLANVLPGCFDKDHIDPLSFERIKVGIASNQRTLVPTDLFDASKLREYYNFSCGTETTEVNYRYDSLDSIEHQNIYAIPTKTVSFLEDFFSRFSIENAFTSLLLNTHIEHSTNVGKKMIVNFEKGRIDVLLFGKDELLFQNSFEIGNAEQVVYYLLNASEVYELDRTAHTLILLGQIEKKSAVYKLLQTYFANPIFGNRPKNLAYNEALNLIPYHCFYNLYCL